jgi:hypothetical protein
MSVVARLDGGNEPLTYILGTKTTPPHYYIPSPLLFKPLIRYFYDRTHTPPLFSSPYHVHRLSNVTAYSTRTIATMPHIQQISEEDARAIREAMYDEQEPMRHPGEHDRSHESRRHRDRPTTRDRRRERVDPYESHARMRPTNQKTEAEIAADLEFTRIHGMSEEDYRRECLRTGEPVGDINFHVNTAGRNRRSVTINPEVTYRTPPISPPPIAHVAPARQPRPRPASHQGPRPTSYHEAKPLPLPPTQPDYPHFDPDIPYRPYWMENIAHTFFTLSLLLGGLIGTVISSILIFVLGLVHCIITAVLVVVGTVVDGLTTILRIFFNLITCHCGSGDWGWEWSHLTRAWQWGRKSRWIWEFVGRVSPDTKEGNEERAAKRASVHEARKEEYKREQEEKGEPSSLQRSASRAAALGNPYARRSMDVDLERGTGRANARVSHSHR